jgi:hypothetical protein
VLFAVDVILVQLSALWMWRHASTHKLLNPTLDSRVVDSIGRRYLLTVAAFGFSIVLAFLSPILVYLAWIGLFVLIFATDWLSWQQTLKTEQQKIALNGASQANITIGHREGGLRLHPGVAQGVLLEGTFGSGVEAHSDRTGDTFNIQLNALQQRGIMSWRYPWSWVPANALDWDVALTPEIPLALTVNVKAGQAELDLTDLNVPDMRFTSSASSIIIHLPTHAGQISLRIEGNLTSYFLHVPQGVAAQIQSSKVISGLDIDPKHFNMIQKDLHYRSADFDTAANRVDIQANLSLGSVQIL